MRGRALLAGVVASLLLVACVPADAAPGRSAGEPPVNPPMESWWRTHFEAMADYGYRLDFGPGSSRSGETAAFAEGWITDVRLVPGLGFVQAGSSTSRLHTQSGVAEYHYETDEGRVREDCTGETIMSGSHQRPTLTLDHRTHQPVLVPWQQLGVLTSCTDNQGSPPSTRVSTLPGLALPAFAPPRGSGGTRMVSYEDEVTYTPQAGDTPCPDELGEYTTRCSLDVVVAASFRLTRVTPRGSTAAVVARDGSSVRVRILCPATCRAQVRVLPASGRPLVLATATRSLPDAHTTVAVDVPRRHRPRLVRSGGARVSIRYTFDHGVSARETRVGSLD